MSTQAPDTPVHSASDRDALRASDPLISAWVSANAGAGKTQLLANRVTRLLLDGTEPARILCLTYTKAAAAEMSRRLYDRLGKWALLPERDLAEALAAIGAGALGAANLARARTLFAQALETPGGLKIQTIHSFCQNLLARFPIEAGVPPGFSILDERSAAELKRLAREIQVLARAHAGERELAAAVTILAARCDYQQFGHTIDAAIGSGARKLRDILARHGGEAAKFFAHLRRTLGVAPGASETDILKRFCSELARERRDCEALADWLLSGSANDQKLGGPFREFIALGMQAESFDKFRSVFVTVAGTRRARLATKKLADASPALSIRLETLAGRLERVEEERKAATTATLTEAVVAIAAETLAGYERLKRTRAALDYDDLIAHTLELLDAGNAASWVLYKLDGGIEHVLVDEAQDTSPEQWRIVVKLVEEFFAGSGVRDAGTRPRTIFAVGDEKQSIFSFQGAAPDEFGRNLLAFKARVEDAHLAFEDLRPAISRRGALAILAFVDGVFAEPSAHAGLTSEGQPTRHEGNREQMGRVEIWPAIKPDNDEKQDPWAPVDAPAASGTHARLAARIAEKIAGWLKRGTLVPGTGKPVLPKDIMILVRRRNAFAEEMIRQLNARGVPVAGADRMQLAEQIAIADLVALGRFVLLPEDDLNLAALLKSPIAGLDEDQLFTLAHGRTGSVWNELVRRQNEPDFAAAYRLLAAALAEADFAAPFEFFGRILSGGARQNLVSRLGTEAADAIDEFLALALMYESAHPPSLEGFLDWFARGADEVKRDLDEGAGAVRVMTIHGAKGLEADIVILPDTAQAPKPQTRAAILYADDCVFYRMPKELEVPATTNAKAQERARELNEYRRLLYVALTRAKNWLIVCGYENKTGMDAESWYPLIEGPARKLCREENDNGETILVLGEAIQEPAHPLPEGGREKEPREGKTPTEAAALPAFLFRPAPADAPAPRILQPSESLGEEPPVRSPFADGAARFGRGLLVHALLAALPKLPREAREAAALAYCARRGVGAAEAAELARESLAILDHPDFAPLFGPGSRAEIGIVADLPELGPGARVSGQIDRLAVSENTVWIADYKTNRPAPSREQDVPKLYRAQMALYRAAVAKIYPGRKITCALLWTEAPRLMPLSDALLDGELAEIARKGQE